MTSGMISETDIVYPVKGRQFGDILYRERTSLVLYLLFPLLWLLSLLYRVVAKIRVFLYKKGIFRSVKLDAYAVSVGNLTVGGTGKTPLVEKIAGDLSRRGGAVAVLTRGYRRSMGGGTLRVPPGPGSIAVVRQAGDEPAMLARRLPAVAVVVDARRLRGGEFAITECGSRILVFDDGFSHLAVRRDCDILLVDGERGFGPGRLLPLGPLREPLGHLRRADHVLIFGGTVESRRALKERINRNSIMEAVYEASGLVSLEDPAGTCSPPDLLGGKRCVAFSGLASPARFEASIHELGGKLLCSFRFPDHHPYDRDDIEMIVARARNVGAELILTTEKDAVKIPRAGTPIPIYYLRVAVRIVSGEDIYESILQRALEESKSAD